jgi:DNA-binding transcriptional ArsR family regulator
VTVQTRRERTLSTPDELKAIADPTRTAILQVLGDRPASAKELSEWLSMTHGRIGHHLKVLKLNGLVEVVRTQKVRALTEKFYGPTFTHLRIDMSSGADLNPLTFMLGHAIREAAPIDEQPFETFGRLYATRMSERRAGEFQSRLIQLADEFSESEEEGEPMFGFVGAVYLAASYGDSADR